MNNLAVDEEETLETIYLQNLRTLESAIPTASENLDTDRAAVWYHNKNEVADRFKLFNLWCTRLKDFMGVTGMSALQVGLQVVV